MIANWPESHEGHTEEFRVLAAHAELEHECIEQARFELKISERKFDRRLVARAQEIKASRNAKKR
jgi:DNA-binding transcriptional regulator YiaG